MRTVRKHIRFYGRVQAVGFRYTIRYHASQLGVTGWVHNEYDGSVTAELQGQESYVQTVLYSLQRERFIRIESFDVTEIPVVEGEKSFRVKH